jgi:hypothetical protein
LFSFADGEQNGWKEVVFPLQLSEDADFGG